VIQQIRGGATTIAQSLSEATVILIDLVGFTALSRKLSPAHLVEVLSDLFRAFDEQSERCGVSKIKTIGDAYMAAAGAPETFHHSAVRAVKFRLEANRCAEETAIKRGIPTVCELVSPREPSFPVC